MPRMEIGTSTCPACKAKGLDETGRLKFRDFDHSIFNGMQAVFLSCRACGFVRTSLPLSDEDLSAYYREQSLQSSLVGVGAGGSTPEDFARYAYYFRLLNGLEKTAQSIADVGCSRGGLLKYIRRDIGHTGNLTGIDADAAGLSSLREIGVNTIAASALDLQGIGEGSFDLAFYTHILEHISDIDAAIEEMKRIMVDGGHVFIEVPDAARYSEARVLDFFWLGIKEHINHFTPLSLCELLSAHGLEIRSINRSNLPIKSGATYPSLVVLAKIRKGRLSSPFAKPGKEESLWFANHLLAEKEFVAKTRHNLQAFLKGAAPGAIWGIGMDFFNLLALDILKIGEHTVLLDSNPGKQAGTVSGRAIVAPAPGSLKAPVVCASSLSWKVIVEQASVWGFDRNQIYCI